jgi:hypothetical protein
MEQEAIASISFLDGLRQIARARRALVESAGLNLERQSRRHSAGGARA